MGFWLEGQIFFVIFSDLDIFQFFSVVSLCLVLTTLFFIYISTHPLNPLSRKWTHVLSDQPHF